MLMYDTNCALIMSSTFGGKLHFIVTLEKCNNNSTLPMELFMICGHIHVYEVLVNYVVLDLLSGILFFFQNQSREINRSFAKPVFDRSFVQLHHKITDNAFYVDLIIINSILYYLIYLKYMCA